MLRKYVLTHDLYSTLKKGHACVYICHKQLWLKYIMILIALYGQLEPCRIQTTCTQTVLCTSGFALMLYCTCGYTLMHFTHYSSKLYYNMCVLMILINPFLLRILYTDFSYYALRYMLYPYVHWIHYCMYCSPSMAFSKKS